jgi:hypothetical protein
VLNRRVTFSSAIPFAVCLTFAAVDWLRLVTAVFDDVGHYIFAGTR